jgi:hypothetical protein
MPYRENQRILLPGLPVETLFCKKFKEILIGHPESSLRMNHPERIKWMNQFPFILFINFEQVI